MGKIRNWIALMKVVFKNVTFMDCWILGYRTERDLAEAKDRIKMYQNESERHKKEIASLKVRTVVIQGFLKTMIGQQPRYCAWFNEEDLRGIHDRFPQMEVKEKDGRTRIRLKEDKKWRTHDVAECDDDGGATDGSEPESTDDVGIRFPE